MDFINYTNLAELHPDDDWRIAVHESGHAITGARNDCIFEYVEIGPNEHGAVKWINSPTDLKNQGFTIEELRYWQMIYAAGAAAEHIVFNEIRMHAIRCDMICHLRVDLRCKCGPVDLFESAIERAIRILLQSKIDLECVAREVMQKKRLQYDDVCALIRVRPPWER